MSNISNTIRQYIFNWEIDNCWASLARLFGWIASEKPETREDECVRNWKCQNPKFSQFWSNPECVRIWNYQFRIAQIFWSWILSKSEGSRNCKFDFHASRKPEYSGRLRARLIQQIRASEKKRTFKFAVTFHRAWMSSTKVCCMHNIFCNILRCVFRVQWNQE